MLLVCMCLVYFVSHVLVLHECVDWSFSGLFDSVDIFVLVLWFVFAYFSLILYSILSPLVRY